MSYGWEANHRADEQPTNRPHGVWYSLPLPVVAGLPRTIWGSLHGVSPNVTDTLTPLVIIVSSVAIIQ